MNGTYRTASRLSALFGLFVAVWAPACQAQVAPPITTLVSFNGRDGINPVSALIQAKDGNRYGTTQYGGANNLGTVFKITTSGTLTTLRSLGPADGAYPQAGLIQAKDGNLYGTCSEGGANGFGTVFKITTSGTLTTLHSFSSLSSTYPYSNSDGAAPMGSLIQGTDGNLYGTTFVGGSDGLGTVFKITTSGVLTTLHSFLGQAFEEGAQPSAGLIQGTDGDLYGTSYNGGVYNAGTVFKITTGGTLTVLHSFSGIDGAGPWAGLIQGADGNLYGTCSGAGANNNGTVFKITTSGALTTLYSFTGGADGANPEAALIQGSDGDLYGTCSRAGANDNGTVFKITTSGALTSLSSFTGDADGADPKAGLIEGKDGNLYGTCSEGGANDNGTVFKLTMTPVITSFSPASGPVGTSITLTGVNFTEAIAVKFGAITVSDFTINSDTSLTFAVPAPGTASAKITVSNSFGSGVSSKAFTMTPVITRFSPASGKVGALVTLTGVNFTGTTSVKIGTMATTFILLSDTSLIVVVPTGAVTAKISVVNSFGTGTSAKNFTVTP